jgi:hypothetical protein
MPLVLPHLLYTVNNIAFSFLGYSLSIGKLSEQTIQIKNDPENTPYFAVSQEAFCFKPCQLFLKCSCGIAHK